jgi:hypothetical protein
MQVLCPIHFFFVKSYDFRDDKPETKEKQIAPELLVCISLTSDFGLLGDVIVNCI